MNILDENVPEGQRVALRTKRVPVRQIGVDLQRKGVKDADLVTQLHALNRPTLFTLDGDFYDRRLCHARYCLVHLDVEDCEVADYVLRFLKHPDFKTRAKRMGCVVQIKPEGLAVWRLHAADEQRLGWS